MNNEEYIIVNKAKLLERIQNLFIEAKELLEEDGLLWQEEFLNYKDFSPNFEEYSENLKYFYIIMGKIEALQQTLSNSIPLIPEIRKALDTGHASSSFSMDGKSNEIKEDYISNLKLNI